MRPAVLFLNVSRKIAAAVNDAQDEDALSGRLGL
jgi:hypothetical protein